MPLPPEFFRELPDMTEQQLSEMLTHPEAYLPEALDAARAELQKRNVPSEKVAQLDAQAEARRVEKENRDKERQKRKLFAKIESKEEAIKAIRGAAYFFWVVAGLQALVGFFLIRAALLDAVVVAMLAAALFIWRSRVAAILLAVISTLAIIVTILNFIGITDSGGINVFFAIAIFLCSLRTVQVTFKFHEFR